MSGRPGHRVTFASRPLSRGKSDAVTGLRFTIEASYGGTVLVDLADCHARPLAIDFAKALRRQTEMGGSLGSANVIRIYVRSYRRFLTWLARTHADVIRCPDLRAHHIDDYAMALEREETPALQRHSLVSKIINTLRAIEADTPTALSSDLRSRLRYILAISVGTSTPRDAYSAFVARTLRETARADVEAIFRRLSARKWLNAEDALLCSTQTDVDDLIERDGIARSTSNQFDRLRQIVQRRGLSIRNLCEAIHGQHHLLKDDLPPLMVLLVLDTGLEPECVKALDVACLTNPHSGTVELRYIKHRARNAQHKSMRVRDGGIGTPGGLIRRVIEASSAARRHVSSDYLWLHYGQNLCAEVVHIQRYLSEWVATHDIRDEDGKPLHLLLSRLRKTHKALWYSKTNGHLARFAVGHTPHVAARHYADLPSLRPLHEAAVTDAFHEAVFQSLPTILPPRDEEALRSGHKPALAQMPPEEMQAILDGEQDVWLAACSGFYRSPFAAAGAPCSQPFWGCIDCRNAVITASKLPAILAFLDFIEEQRSRLTGHDWAVKFGHAHARITKQILPAFPEPSITEARLKASSAQLYLPPEARQ